MIKYLQCKLHKITFLTIDKRNFGDSLFFNQELNSGFSSLKVKKYILFFSKIMLIFSKCI